MSASTGKVPGRIFMSYRREETAYPAGWLYDRLASHFGRDQVFKDIDSIELGDDFVDVITTAVGACDVLLAVIGIRWLTISGQDGRRLENPGDFVRLEIEAALARNVRVIPILVDGARMPTADELPASLAQLARRQALELSPSRFDADTERLLRVLDRTIASQRRRVEELQRQVRERAAAQDWDAVLAASDELAALDPAAADPDGLASTARQQIARRQQAEEAAATQRRRVEELQRQVRKRAAAQDWDAVLAASDELAALDPAAADPDGLASTARQQAEEEAYRRVQEEAARRPHEEAKLRDREMRARVTGRDGDPDGARDQLAALLPDRERVSGTEHPDTLTVRRELAHWTGKAGDPATARDQLAALLPVVKRALGTKYPDTLTTQRQLDYWTNKVAALKHAAVPTMPDISPSEQLPGIPYPLLDGLSPTIGWQFQPQAKDGPTFVIIRRSRLGALKVVQSFPLTEDGWSGAWQVLIAQNPAAVPQVLAALRARETDAARLRATRPTQPR